MSKKIYLSLVFIISVCSATIGQSIDNMNNNEVNKNSVSFNILGSGSYVGVTYERLLFQRLSLEAGIGIIGIGGGLTFYPVKKVQLHKINPFIGVKYTNHAIVDGVNKSVAYIPIGLTYHLSQRFSLSADVGPAHYYYKSPGYKPTEEELKKYPYSKNGVFGNAKFSFHF